MSEKLGGLLWPIVIAGAMVVVTFVVLMWIIPDEEREWWPTSGPEGLVQDETFVRGYGNSQTFYEDLRVIAEPPRYNSETGVTEIVLSVENVGDVGISVTRFNVARYTLVDERGLSDFLPFCESVQYRCDGHGRIEPGEIDSRVIAFQTDDVSGNLEVGFYGIEWFKTVTYVPNIEVYRGRR